MTRGSNDKTPVWRQPAGGRVIPVEAESVCPICSRGILDLDDNSSSYAAGWPGSLHKADERQTGVAA